ncbi:MAG TPA: hypothetical protein VJ972_06770 [Anaerolineales bacterium]|nr:hypothetical protein [Anaerolineales bacterium]
MTDKKKDKPEKEEKDAEKPVRVQFGKDLTSRAMVDAINTMQNNWALRHPEKAHDLYPSVYDKNGKRIKVD